VNSPKHPPYWNSTSGFDFEYITTVDMSFCASLRNFIKIGPPSAEKNKKIKSCQFSRWWICNILDFRGPIMGSLQSPCMTCYRSSLSGNRQSLSILDFRGPIMGSLQIQDTKAAARQSPNCIKKNNKKSK